MSATRIFLVPGLVMMSVLQNAFANSSSSLVHSKVSGNIVILLLPPISASAFYLAYAGAATLRGVVVGAGVLVGGYFFASPSIASPLIVFIFRADERDDDGIAGNYRRAVVGKIRPHGGVSEFHYYAADIFVGGVLFHSVAAAVLARSVKIKSVFLYD